MTDLPQAPPPVSLHRTSPRITTRPDQIRCVACRLEVIDLPLEPDVPADRDAAREMGWSWKRWNGQWVAVCATCTVQRVMA